MTCRAGDLHFTIPTPNAPAAAGIHLEWRKRKKADLVKISLSAKEDFKWILRPLIICINTMFGPIIRLLKQLLNLPRISLTKIWEAVTVQSKGLWLPGISRNSVPEYSATAQTSAFSLILL